MRANGVSIAKFGETTNEDAVLAKEGLIAVSDGAGGGGVYAHQWSRYLIENLPQEPICSFSDFDTWVDGIWEDFYYEHEQLAKQQDGLFLNKFYDEGSYATLVAVWKVSENECKWITYGDSVAFCYDRSKGELNHSFTKLSDFNLPPYLINSKDPLDEKGFRSGSFQTSGTSVVFCASDALSHMIIMMYEVWMKQIGSKRFDSEIRDAILAQTKNSQYVELATKFGIDFDRKMKYLLRLSKRNIIFRSGMYGHRFHRLIADDDYSLAVMDYDDETFNKCFPLINID